jgi:trimethylamine:corrinoid methyltransferase-like protein
MKRTQIISEGIALLENPGIRVHNQEALEILANAGAIWEIYIVSRAGMIRPANVMRKA